MYGVVKLLKIKTYSKGAYMKINISNIYIIHKSETCFSKNGNPLSVYNSFAEAQESANYQSHQSATSMTAYQCATCGKYHLKPTEFYCKKLSSYCSCTDHNGKRKDAYPTEQDAEKMISIRKRDGVTLYTYRCPQGNGYHLTSNRGY